MLSFEEFSRALQDAVERLPPVTLEELAAEGVSVRREDVPKRFRVSFGKTFRIDVAS